MASFGVIFFAKEGSGGCRNCFQKRSLSLVLDTVLSKTVFRLSPSILLARFDSVSKLHFYRAILATKVVIFFSRTEAPLPDPTPTPPKTPKRIRNGPETDPKRSQTEPNGAKMDRNQALRVGLPGMGGGGGGCKSGVWRRGEIGKG